MENLRSIKKKEIILQVALPMMLTVNYWRNQFLIVDSCYIGNWQEDMRQGYGVFCDFENHEYKSGIWSENELIQQGALIDPTELQIQIDSVFTYCKQGLQQLKK